MQRVGVLQRGETFKGPARPGVGHKADQEARTPWLVSKSCWYTLLVSQNFCSSGSRCAELARILKLVLGRMTVSLYGESPV